LESRTPPSVATHSWRRLVKVPSRAVTRHESLL
jgi:hypothetical protein